jgi:hypothetical protein
VQLTGPWTTDETSSAGQVFEWRVWAVLTEQSRGQLHVFLPLSDRGIDALVHRRTDDAYISVQAKSRSTLTDGEVHITIWADSLQDDNAVLVAGMNAEGALGPTLLVIPEGDFKRLAVKSSNNGKPVYTAFFGMHPRSDTKWLPWLVPSERLGERFGVAVSIEMVVEPRRPEWRSDVGSLGEIETARLLATSGELNLFRPFPDDETSELGVLHLGTRRVVGIQIKTVEINASRLHATVTVYASSFRPSPKTYVVVLAWIRDEGRFHDDCLLIPSTDIPNLCTAPDSRGHMSFTWHPGSPAKGALSPYRTRRESLCAAVGRLSSGGQSLS